MNKPVACVYQQFGIGRVSWLAEVPPDGTPLYTHPVKELTDEEIHQVFKETWDATTNPNCVMTAFAKAILRKAQEQ